ncbi:MAG: hypothetical protein U0350_41105 [Caldilineaceae bacterium]
MKAINLQQVIRFFNPAEPLRGQHLRDWFVERPNTSRGRVRILLETALEPQKLLFVGHRGSGKSTELNKLAEELEKTFFTIGLDVLAVSGRTTPGYEDLMLALSTQVIRTCIDKGLVNRPLAGPLQDGWQNMVSWWQRIVAGLPLHSPNIELSTSVEFSTWLGQVSVGASQSSQTREALNDQINQQMPELLEHLNWVIEQAEAALNPKRLLLIVEGLDKVDLESARSIFRDHAPTITTPKASMIYTFPLALRHSDDYDTVRRSFDDDRYLHNIATHHADGADDVDGVAALRRLALLRMEERLMAEDALALIVHTSGGIPVQLIKLVRNAAVYALDRDEKTATILLVDVQNAVKDLRRELNAPLRSADWTVLRNCRQLRRLTGDDELQRLLYNGSLIEYSNDHQRCDVNPILWGLLEENETA